MNADMKKGLGRGLASLLGDDSANDYAQLDKLRQSKNVGIELIRPGKFQPRQEFDADALNQLADSIRAKGVLQPLLVRRDPQNPNHYELIAGERRWRAAQIAQLHEVPVIIKDLTDREALEIGLIENLQRRDLNPIEEAMAFRRLMEEFNRSQEDMAEQIGKSRSYISNATRLLDLPKSAQKLLASGKLSPGHGKLLIGLPNADELAEQIIDKQLTVRQSEQLVQFQRARLNSNAPSPVGRITTDDVIKNPANANRPGDEGPDANTRDLEKQLMQLLGMKVDIKFMGKAGQLTIHYQTLDQLDDILRRLGKK